MKVKIEAAGFSETFVTTYETTRCQNPEDNNKIFQRTAPLAFLHCETLSQLAALSGISTPFYLKLTLSQRTCSNMLNSTGAQLKAAHITDSDSYYSS
jgi:hypothetical protein